jgi:4-diphosphocytidyl-2-C-methyl-D-erythritol kinase
MTARLATRAPAKVNLSLAVLGRRADGYHELDSLVAFAGTGDDLSLTPGEAISLEVTGPRAAGAGDPGHNLVLKAARALLARRPRLRVGAFHLIKRLPAAAGIGGGSSDAAAALRLLARLNGLPVSDPAVREAAAATGADVPVCLEPRLKMMRGIGDILGPPLRGRFFAVLANPGVPVETASVFRALVLQARPPKVLERGGAVSLDEIAQARNDLEGPAVGLAPVIGEALALLRAQPGCRLARMSGSGATVFGLFDDCRSAALAGKQLAAARPGWWVRATLLR